MNVFHANPLAARQSERVARLSADCSSRPPVNTALHNHRTALAALAPVRWFSIELADHSTAQLGYVPQHEREPFSADVDRIEHALTARGIAFFRARRWLLIYEPDWAQRGIAAALPLFQFAPSTATLTMNGRLALLSSPRPLSAAQLSKIYAGPTSSGSEELRTAPGDDAPPRLPDKPRCSPLAPAPAPPSLPAARAPEMSPLVQPMLAARRDWLRLERERVSLEAKLERETAHLQTILAEWPGPEGARHPTETLAVDGGQSSASKRRRTHQPDSI